MFARLAMSLPAGGACERRGGAFAWSACHCGNGEVGRGRKKGPFEKGEVRRAVLWPPRPGRLCRAAAAGAALCRSAAAVQAQVRRSLRPPWVAPWLQGSRVQPALPRQRLYALPGLAFISVCLPVSPRMLLSAKLSLLLKHCCFRVARMPFGGIFL